MISFQHLVPIYEFELNVLSARIQVLKLINQLTVIDNFKIQYLNLITNSLIVFSPLWKSINKIYFFKLCMASLSSALINGHVKPTLDIGIFTLSKNPNPKFLIETHSKIFLPQYILTQSHCSLTYNFWRQICYNLFYRTCHTRIFNFYYQFIMFYNLYCRKQVNAINQFNITNCLIISPSAFISRPGIK